jgi:ADP-ribosylglycohydrolase
MSGAIIGDIVGSVHEHGGTKSTDFPLLVPQSRFTDDSVMTIATAEALLSGEPFDRAYRRWGRRYPHAGYGGAFRRWLHVEGAGPYGSWGNGSAMRVSPVALARDSAEQVLAEAERSAAMTHDHPEGIKGAQAAALAVFLARTGISKSEIRRELTDRFGYDLSRTIDEIRPTYRFDVSCQGSVPEALIAFLDTPSLEDAVRAAISLGGDADTQAAIAGAAAAAFDDVVSEELLVAIRGRLPADMLEVLDAFTARWPLRQGTSE